MKLSFKKKTDTTSRPALRGGLLHEIATDPFLDWIMILCISLAVALVLVGTGVSVYLDSRARIETQAPLTGHRPALPLDKALLGKTLDLYDGRAVLRGAILRRWDFPADPSLQ